MDALVYHPYLPSSTLPSSLPDLNSTPTPVHIKEEPHENLFNSPDNLFTLPENHSILCNLTLNNPFLPLPIKCELPENHPIFRESQIVSPENDSILPGSQRILLESQSMLPDSDSNLPENPLSLPERHSIMPENHSSLPENQSACFPRVLVSEQEYERLCSIVRVAFADRMRQYSDMEVLGPDLKPVLKKEQNFDHLNKVWMNNPHFSSSRVPEYGGLDPRPARYEPHFPELSLVTFSENGILNELPRNNSQALELVRFSEDLTLHPQPNILRRNSQSSVRVFDDQANTLRTNSQSLELVRFSESRPKIPRKKTCSWEIVRVSEDQNLYSNGSQSFELVKVGVSNAIDLPESVYRSQVRTTRMTYEALRFFFMQKEEEPSDNCTLAEAMRPRAGLRPRFDLKAATTMHNRGIFLNRDRVVGSIPGISVGDLFFYRVEMAVLGVHRQIQAGIDYIPASRTNTGEPIATSIIASGGYEDDDDHGEVLVYTGHGGRDYGVSKHSLHQKLERGNLALEKSRHYGINVRVIRGFKRNDAPTGRVYVYDGLYSIQNSWSEIGKSGFSVYKYRLVRIPNQPEMGSSVIKFVDSLKSNSFVRPCYFHAQLSMGKEKVPVILFNDVDMDSGPLGFEYFPSPIYPMFVFQQGDRRGGCNCLGGCVVDCSCISVNGNRFPYDHNGILMKGRPLIYECGMNCRCPPSCRNRVTQKGVKFHLEVFRNRENGWGVRSLDLIPAGAFICEISGQILTRQQATVASMNGASLIYAKQFEDSWVEWGNISQFFPELFDPTHQLRPELSFAIDVSRVRNVACYLNQSCSPNVMVQCVLYDHQNACYPHLMIFAIENIPPMRELTIDYGVVGG
ncbi:histone-lysine N-methyltransferase family member SUVH9 [Amborella trichopoda]|uniref:SET domain-containing protein n=1 Tax=Amborella trichopoda TaxID=13333 RepID=U5CR98_AMBTC|nr:histone-lysine N-methyltransferase family member SUVH9 [Amborella trichopoda]ERN15731.1 hypothetical protein AMTR_s00039p00046970 [Amborella trichopoda]|eukprot:XP_006854264.1 histone-lysine N-methyltransferase family member SUVH9 [Amborella trichopoda]